MKHLSIWSYNGGCFMVPQMDIELGSSCSLVFGKIRCCGDLLHGRNYSFSVVSRNLRDRFCCGNSKSDVGFWSFSGQSKLRCIVFGGMRKKGSFDAFFALALALEREAVGDELVKEGQVSDNVSSGEEAVEGVIDSDNKNVESKGEGEVKEKKSKWVDVRQLTRKLSSAKTADDVEEVLKDMSELPNQVYATMIKGLGYDLLMDSAKSLVEWLKRKKIEDGFVGPDIFIYNSLLGAAKRSKQYGEAEKIMNDMAQEGITPNLVTYNTLMCIYGDQGEFDKAHNILEEIPKRGFNPDAVSYSTALLAYQSTGDANGAIFFFAKYSEKYLTDDTQKDQKDGDVNWAKEYVKFENLTLRICYEAMRGWLVESENLNDNVLRLLTLMDKVGIKLTREDLQRLVWACTRKEHYTVAKDLYGRIREEHSKINLSVCNHVIWLFGKARKWWEALEVYEDLLDKGPRPDNLSRELIMSHFNFLLKKAKQKGIWTWGAKLINQMVDKGLKPGADQWNAVLAACSKACDPTAAVQIFKRMLEQGEKPTILTYGTLLSSLEKGKFYEEALQVWNHMIKVGLEPNDYAYTIMSSIFSAQEKFDMVDALIRDMAASGVEPTVVTYNAIISGCAHNRRSSVAYEWFHRMKVQNITPNEITYEMMVQALGNDGKPQLAYEMYLRARGECLNLSARAYDAVVDSSRTYKATADLSALGPRPADPINKMDIRKNDRKELYVQEAEEGTNELYAREAEEGSDELYSREAEEGSDELYAQEAEE